MSDTEDLEKITSIYSTLYPYQKEKLLSDLENCKILNNASRSYCIKVCPKCGSKTPNWTRGGRANSGKQMLVCHSCNHRTVVDYGQLTYYSQQDRSKWDQLIKDTFQQVPIQKSAESLGISTYTVWRMRMKLLHALEAIANETVVSDEVEMDEKYLLNSHKGEKREDIKPRHRGEKASKRGLSGEQVCLLTAVQRQGDAVLMATNMAAPKSEDIEKIQKNLSGNCLVWIDGKTAYQRILNQKNCEFRVLGDHKTYTSVDHLNNVNSFHSRIDEWNRGYRGVATKYINRYAALLVTVRKYAGFAADEVLLKVRTMLSNVTDFFRICDMKTSDLFAY